MFTKISVHYLNKVCDFLSSNLYKKVSLVPCISVIFVIKFSQKKYLAKVLCFSAFCLYKKVSLLPFKMCDFLSSNFCKKGKFIALQSV